MTTVPASRPAGRVLTIVLAVVYAVLLVLVILLKFPFNGPEGARVLNLIPFAGTRGSAWGQDIENVVAFVPLGLYLSMLFPRSPFPRRLLIVIATTVVFEVLQYIFAIGRADITDVIDNT